MPGNNQEFFWKRNLDKIGIGGSILAALCCLGLPAVLSIVSAIGLGFLINDAVLLPLLILFLIITIGGLILGKRRHQKPHALFLGGISSLAMFLFIFVMYNKILAYVGVVGLIAAVILNVRLNVKK